MAPRLHARARLVRANDTQTTYVPDVARLKHTPVPAIVLRILLSMLANPALRLSNGLDAAELFAGCCSVTTGLRSHGFSCIPFEIKMLGKKMDLLSNEGYCVALTLVLRMGLRGRGLLWLAPVCSTWVVMSCGTTMRSKLLPFGDESLDCVKQANVMNSRVVALCMLAHFMGLTFIVEPRASLKHMRVRIGSLAPVRRACTRA